MESMWGIIVGAVNHVFEFFYFVGSMYSWILEYVLIFGLVAAFLYHIFSIRKDESLWRDMAKWLSSSIGAIFLVLICLYISPSVFEDDNTMWRYIIIRITGICIGVVGISGALLFLDSVTRGDWLGQIEKTEYGPVIVLSAMILALSFIIVYA